MPVIIGFVKILDVRCACDTPKNGRPKTTDSAKTLRRENRCTAIEMRPAASIFRRSVFALSVVLASFFGGASARAKK